jgi:transposase
MSANFLKHQVEIERTHLMGTSRSGSWPEILIELTDEERTQLQKISRLRMAAYQHVQRAKALLMAADGVRNRDIGRRLDTGERTVLNWRKDFLLRRLESLSDRARTGRKRRFEPAVRAAAVHLACLLPGTAVELPPPQASEAASEPAWGSVPDSREAQQALPQVPGEVAPSGENQTCEGLPCPSDHLPASPAVSPEPVAVSPSSPPPSVVHAPESRFSAASIASLLVTLQVVTSISVRTVQRWLDALHLKPWRFRSWLTPKDLAHFLPRACPVLDLYERVRRGTLKPGEVVFSIDEKTSIQARQRAVRKPPRPGRVMQVEHSYLRRGAVHLIAALHVASGLLWGGVYEHKRFVEFSDFLTDLLRQAIAAGARRIHLILDNGSTHRPKYLATWLMENFPKDTYGVEFDVHWLPVRSSWLNQIENTFSVLQRKVLQPNDFSSRQEVALRIVQWMDQRNLAPKPINWTYTSQQLRAKYQVREQMAA